MTLTNNPELPPTRNGTDRMLLCILEGFNDKGITFTDETRFLEDFDMDSLSKIELVMELEDEFHISVSDEETQALVKVGDLKPLLIKHGVNGV